MRIFQLNISPGGVPKLPIREAHCGELGLDGDGHAHPKIHGGPERALCLFSLEVISALQAEDHPIWPGAAGENVTISGADWPSLAVGQRYALGESVIIELTRPTEPCKNIAASFVEKNFRRIDHAKQPGWSRWYAKVSQEGLLRVGDPIRRVLI